eukprot:CAMPEP_0171074142 /NCGR_PEP_ID=MMETSP0766_2-20121228/11955_1 /TAXON_ID=439317 /ORGANISM="Gambierdiscus australes, Strain CAWD 149" /LENGTH=235 /DNA_ID=CAMNT_0011530903 /DNA_START=21 /DNA_END=728 /DNA_ORIENTATION=+
MMVAAFKAAATAGAAEAINRTVLPMCCVPVRLDIEEGVYDVIFEVLRNYQDDKYQYVQQNAWRGLSDQSHTELGARVIANVGGPNKGIEYMVQQMQAHPEPYYALCSDHLTLKYEIMACISGLVKNDQENVWGPAAVEAGLLEQLVYTMRAEPDLIATQATACRVMDPLLQRNPQYVAPLLSLGALELVETAMERFKGGDDTPFHFGTTVGEMYDITSSCQMPHLVLLAGRNATA